MPAWRLQSCSLLLVYLLLLLLSEEEKALTFTDVTSEVGLSHLKGVFAVAAFSDFNADKNLDIALVNRSIGQGKWPVYCILCSSREMIPTGEGDGLSLLLWTGHQFTLHPAKLVYYNN